MPDCCALQKAETPLRLQTASERPHMHIVIAFGVSGSSSEIVFPRRSGEMDEHLPWQACSFDCFRGALMWLSVSRVCRWFGHLVSGPARPQFLL